MDQNSDYKKRKNNIVSFSFWFSKKYTPANLDHLIKLVYLFKSKVEDLGWQFVRVTFYDVYNNLLEEEELIECKNIANVQEWLQIYSSAYGFSLCFKMPGMLFVSDEIHLLYMLVREFGELAFRGAREFKVAEYEIGYGPKYFETHN